MISANYTYVKEELVQHAPEITVCDMEGTYLPMLDREGCGCRDRYEDAEGEFPDRFPNVSASLYRIAAVWRWITVHGLARNLMDLFV